MQFPGVSPFSGFGGANILSSRLTPTSLEERKRQLVNKLVTGGGASQLTVGAGQGDAPGRAPGLAFNPFMASYLNSLGGGAQDPQSPFFGGSPTPSGGGGGGGQVSNPAAPPPTPASPSPSSVGGAASSGAVVHAPVAPSGASRFLFGGESAIHPVAGMGSQGLYAGLTPAQLHQIIMSVHGGVAGI